MRTVVSQLCSQQSGECELPNEGQALNNVALETRSFVGKHWPHLLGTDNLETSLHWSVFNWIFNPHGHSQPSISRKLSGSFGIALLCTGKKLAI